MNADGTNPQRLTNNPEDDVFPSWGNMPTTASGRKIVFHSDRDGNAEVYSMNSNGTDQIRLTNNPAADSEAWFTLTEAASFSFPPATATVKFTS